MGFLTLFQKRALLAAQGNNEGLGFRRCAVKVTINPKPYTLNA